MSSHGTLKLRVFGSVVALSLLAPVTARASFMALTSPNQISGSVFTFDTLEVGFVDGDTNAVTQPLGFTFPDAGEPLSGEFIASASTASGAGHVLDVLGGTLGFDGLVRFEFEDVVEAAGIEYDTATQLSFLAFDGDGNAINPEGSILAPPDTRGFFGITSDAGIGGFLVHDSAGTFQLDNMKFGAIAVPVPGAWALCAVGLGLIGVVRRRI